MSADTTRSRHLAGAVDPAPGRDADRASDVVRARTPDDRRERRVRIVGLALVLSQGVLGAWAYLFPHGFYTGFPVPTAGWLPALGAYDGHLVRDLGIAWIALAIVGTWAARQGSVAALRVVLRAFLVSGVLHLAYHLTTFEHFGPVDMAAQVVALVVLVVVPAVLLVLSHPRRGGPR